MCQYEDFETLWLTELTHLQAHAHTHTHTHTGDFSLPSCLPAVPGLRRCSLLLSAKASVTFLFWFPLEWRCDSVASASFPSCNRKQKLSLKKTFWSCVADRHSNMNSEVKRIKQTAVGWMCGTEELLIVKTSHISFAKSTWKSFVIKSNSFALCFHMFCFERQY